MKHDQHEESRRAARRAHVVETAERVLAQAYRACTAEEMRESQLRVREAVVREMRRRIR